MANKAVEIAQRAEEAVARRAINMLNQNINSLKVEVVKLSRNNNDSRQVFEEVIALLVHTGSSLHILDMDDLYSLKLRKISGNTKHTVPVFKSKNWCLKPEVATELGITEHSQLPMDVITQAAHPTPPKPKRTRKRKIKPPCTLPLPQQSYSFPTMTTPLQPQPIAESQQPYYQAQPDILAQATQEINDHALLDELLAAAKSHAELPVLTLQDSDFPTIDPFQLNQAK